jgi:hypothetical protein
MEYAGHGEAPKHMYFWAGVSAIAGALERKVWIDQAYFNWYPNFYIVFVAPPGVVSKSTTVGIAMEILKDVPGVKFGPDVVTWQALVTTFANAQTGFEFQSETHVMSPITLESSEFGNLLDPSDKQMVDLLVSLWDGKKGEFRKETKHSGNDSVVNPWINLIACTTPSWIAGNFPEYMIGGGFTSRCIFVYADKKERFIAYPGLEVSSDFGAQREKLRADLEHIHTTLSGPYVLSEKAIRWGTIWYEKHNTIRPAALEDDRFGGYLARKQTHIHKLAMVLAASSSDVLVITDQHLALAETMVSDLEPDMQFVFNKIGKSDAALYTEKLISFVQSRVRVPYMEAYRFVHMHFPSMRDFEDVLAGCVRAGYIRLEKSGDSATLVASHATVPTSKLRESMYRAGGASNGDD